MLDLGIFGRRRIRPIRQTEVGECGLAALAMVANFHGMSVDMASLRRRFSPSMRGASLKSLMQIADQLDFLSRPVKVPLEALPALRGPAILHWDMNHYVVMERVAGGKALVHDPRGSSGWLPMAEVSRHFTGVALEIWPAGDFEPAVLRSRLRLSQFWQRMTGLKRALLQVLILTLVLEAFVIASPYYMQVAIDRAIPALDLDLMAVLAVGFGLFAIINAVTSLLRAFTLLSAGTSIGFAIAANISRRLFRLPVAWFERRHTGDILSRFQSITPIQQFMTQGATGLLIDGSLAFLTLALMLFYSVALTTVALTAFALYAVVRAISFSAQRAAQEQVIAAAGQEQSVLIESVRGIVTLRLFNKEAIRHAVWQARLADSMNANVSLSRVGAWQSAANALLLGLESIVSVWLAVKLVITGGFSIGMVFAFMAYKTQFLQRVGTLIDQGIAFRMLGLHMERLSDIVLADQDAGFTENHEIAAALSGRIELRAVSYRYGASEPLVLDRLDLVIEPGAHVAITGASGEGKSTLVKILLGLATPEAGEMLVDGMLLARFGHRNYRDQVGAVLQEDSLFAGSLIENIALFDEAADPADVTAAARLASLHDDITAMPMGYDTLVGDMGSSLSGGQKQRLLLARALYRKPAVLIVDEGTSHLDTDREKQVNAAISDLGITRVIVAHRLESIFAADRVFEMRGGGLIDITEHISSLRTEHDRYRQDGSKLPVANSEL